MHLIVSLRSDPARTQYMLTLDNDVESQVQWIREYKKREKEGTDYYFIYYDPNNRPIGLNRVSHIDYQNKNCKESSWIVVKGLSQEAWIMQIIKAEIVFNILNLKEIWGEVHKENKRAIRIFELFNYTLTDNKSDFYKLTLEKAEFFDSLNKSVLKRLIHNQR